MRTSRVYVAEPLSAQTLVEVGGPAANHIARVLRLQAGAAITAFDGRGGEYQARIDAIRKDRVLVSVGAHRAIERESPLAATLAQGISRGERMDFVVQKATELGVQRIVPLITERTVVRLDAKQAQAKVRHWRAIVVAACEQCGRNILPQVSQPQGLEALLAEREEPLQRLVLSPSGEQRVRELAFRGPVLVLIGPEGGLSDTELEMAVRAGFQAVRLGPRILRTETAAVAALAALQLELGDL
ncbi:MAG: 16S rRNA (uracil(1498)-N(3))-methyltransferase [Steroidobacteraceae bacterium]